MLIQYLSLLIHWTPLLQWPLPSPNLQHWFPWLNCLEVGITTCSTLSIIQISNLTLHPPPLTFSVHASWLFPSCCYCSFFPRITFSSATTLTPRIHTQLSFSSLSPLNMSVNPNLGSNQFFIHFFLKPLSGWSQTEKTKSVSLKFLITKT